MIRYYAYYSCGGYKDMYLGNSLDNVEYSYFLPLLPKWKSMMEEPVYLEKVRRVEELQLIRLISKDIDYDFPAQAKCLFSHGGYRAIYMTLSNGDTCFCVKDIINGAKDEESRDIPFNILFTASGTEDIKRLDRYALSSLSHTNEFIDSLATLFSYDPIVNGVKFNVSQINRKISDNAFTWAAKEINHYKNQVVFLVVDSLSMAETAYSELHLSKGQVGLLTDCNGKSIGAINYHETSLLNKKSTFVEVDDSSILGIVPSTYDDQENLETKPVLNKSEVSLSSTDNLAKNSTDSPTENIEPATIDSRNLLLTLSEIKDTLSINASSLKRIHENISGTKSEVTEQSVLILEQINYILKNQQSLTRTEDSNNSQTVIIQKAHLWVICIAFILGFIWGSLIF